MEQLQACAASDPAVVTQQLGILLASSAAAAATAAATASSSGPTIADELAFSKKPRPVQYKPYGLKDYEERAFDAKRASGYWQLGRLGPENENKELLAKVRAGLGDWGCEGCYQ